MESSYGDVCNLSDTYRDDIQKRSQKKPIKLTNSFLIELKSLSRLRP